MKTSTICIPVSYLYDRPDDYALATNGSGERFLVCKWGVYAVLEADNYCVRGTRCAGDASC